MTKGKVITHPLDKYYTRTEVVKRCVDSIPDMDSYDCMIEPSAGAGAFVKALDAKKLIAMDIEPDDARIQKADWLAYKIDQRHKRVLIIGNPPFGVHHSLSDAFLRHAFSFENVQTIAFVLPNTYRKHTRQRIIPKHWRIKQIMDLGKNAFTYQGNIQHMPCSFFLLDKSAGRDLRIHEHLYREATDFKFGQADDYDIFMFGASPTKLIKQPTANNRGHFLKSKIALDELIRRLKAMPWQGNACANGGVAWFTKTEIVYQYNQFFGAN